MIKLQCWMKVKDIRSERRSAERGRMRAYSRRLVHLGIALFGPAVREGNSTAYARFDP
jgi:hypothetical protein